MASAEHFGPRLRELREQAGLTQEQLAERAGVKRDAVARWEGGRREPSWGNVLALCQALGVDCNAFTVPPAGLSPPGPRRGVRRAPPAQPEARESPARLEEPPVAVQVVSDAPIDVLLAEDDAPLRAGLRALLEREGYRCAEAPDGPEAVRLALRSPPGCVVLD